MYSTRVFQNKFFVELWKENLFEQQTLKYFVYFLPQEDRGTKTEIVHTEKYITCTMCDAICPKCE